MAKTRRTSSTADVSSTANTAQYAYSDTIVALSSRWADCTRSVVRLSGNDALKITHGLFTTGQQSLDLSSSHTAQTGWITLSPTTKCPCKIYLFRAPASYTGQDLIEFHLPGSTALARMALTRLQLSGARTAQPGEFTLRAFLSGKIDLTQAQAVADIIASQTDTQLRAANSLANGQLSRAIQKIQADLATLIADTEANIDFLDQDIDFIDAPTALAKIKNIAQQVDDLLNNALHYSDLQAQPVVVLAGWANAGKSTLLNALSGRTRAITSPQAGTTRDVLMAPMQINNIDTDILLIDAAGLSDHSFDELGAAARQAALSAIKRADLLLYVIDVSSPVKDQQWQTLDTLNAPQILIVANKTDLPTAQQQERILAHLQKQRHEKVLPVSAKNHHGLAQLQNQIKAHVKTLETTVSAGRLVLSTRAKDALEHARRALTAAKDLLSQQKHIKNPELVVMDLYEVNATLGTITGRVTSEDVLKDIFSRFCIGK